MPLPGPASVWRVELRSGSAGGAHCDARHSHGISYRRTALEKAPAFSVCCVSSGNTQEDSSLKEIVGASRKTCSDCCHTSSFQR